jgi:predicted ATPase/DNA-binding SARP family transcriptional activator/tetratricopeptide (TPR) repeat protein
MAGMASDVRIGILGPLEVWVGFGEPVEVVGPRLRALLVRLALDPDRVVLGEQLVDAVWDEEPPAAAANALQSLVSRLRRVLPDLVESHPAGYRLALDPEAIDAVRFENLALAGREELRRDPRRAGSILREALALWRGPALADAGEADFAAAARAGLEERRLGALEDRVDADLSSGGDDRLVAELDELVTAHPLRERLCGQLMRALSRAGRQADALAAYQRLRARLAEELGIDPSKELQAVHVAVLRGETAPPPMVAASPTDWDRGGEPRERPPAEAAALAPPMRVRTNLRAQITSFVGRAEDIARITAVLAGARLVTLTGAGGAGKTRLASEAAARLLDRMPDGVWLVELGSVVDPVDLPQAVLSLFGARELGLLAPLGATAVPPLERLVEAVGGKRLLLVLDNCEHLVAAVAALVDRLLARCPALRVLATSREPLGLTGEVLHPVGPLAMPQGDVTPGEALRYPAVRLFADRGAAARPGFGVDEATLRPVVRICRALDGMPLAIELAAARLRALSPGQIAARLDDRFRLLAAGGRPALPRHQTLRAVVDWSWDLLGDAERVLLRRLSVFAGGATLEAVERVCAGPGLGGLAPDEVLYLLAALVDKSLVVAGEDRGSGGLKSEVGAGAPGSQAEPSGSPSVDSGSGEVRYAMLETVRAYGQERRRDAGEDEALRRAHAGDFLELAERAEPQLRRRDQLRWIGRLSAERDNLHAALRWAIDSQDVTLALRLVSGLGWYWFLRSARAEALEWTEKALALPGEAAPTMRAGALFVRASIALGGGSEMAHSLEYVDEALEIVRGLPVQEQRTVHPMLAFLPTMAAMFHNDDLLALERARELLEHPDPWIRAISHATAGGLLVNLGEAAAAEAELDLGLAGFRELGERWGIGNVLIARAELSATRGQHDTAVSDLEEAREVFVGLGDREDVSQIMIRLAGERARVGELEQARADLAMADRVAHEVGAEDQRFFVRHSLSDIARWQGRLDEARELADQAMALFERGSFPIFQRQALLLASRGRVDLAAGDPRGAHAWYERALEPALASGDRPVIARVVELLADIALAGGDAEQAATLLGTAEVLRGMPDEADVDVARMRDAARAALGEDGFALAYRRGAARRGDEVLAELSVSSSAAGTPAAPAEQTPPR